MAEAEALAAQLATGPAHAFAPTKKAVQAAETNTLDQHLDLERILQREAGMSDDYLEGVAAFLQKRKPDYSGRGSA